MSLDLIERPELCTVGERKPKGNGSNQMNWTCGKCRLAWIAAVMDGTSMPANPDRQVHNARIWAARLGDAHLALAAEVLNLRITPEHGVQDGGGVLMSLEHVHTDLAPTQPDVVLALRQALAKADDPGRVADV